VLAARRELIDQQLKEITLQAKVAAAAARLYYFYGPGAEVPTTPAEASR